jgi:hypothetical protein
VKKRVHHLKADDLIVSSPVMGEPRLGQNHLLTAIAVVVGGGGEQTARDWQPTSAEIYTIVAMAGAGSTHKQIKSRIGAARTASAAMPRRRKRSGPRELVLSAINGTFPDGLPDVSVMPNQVFIQKVRNWIKLRPEFEKVGLLNDKTILRAAKRAK